MSSHKGRPLLDTNAGKEVLAALTQTPQSSAQLAKMTGHHVSLTSKVLADAFGRGMVRRERKEGPAGTGRSIYMWSSAKSYRLGEPEKLGTYAPKERGDYHGEPNPLRYVPRGYTVMTLGCIGVDVLSSAQQETMK